MTGTWAQLERDEPDLAAAGRTLLLNCAPTWGIALLGTTAADGSPLIGPLCVYVVDDRLVVTIEGKKERDLQRDRRYFLHSYWGDGQDEFGVAGEASDPLAPDDHARLVTIEPRLAYSPLRELGIAKAHAVLYREFPTPQMYADVTVWQPDQPTRRWRRDDPPPPA
jgi:hypothetical protein